MILKNLSHDSSVHKVIDGRETLLQAKADCAKGDAVGEGDIPVDEEDGRR